MYLGYTFCSTNAKFIELIDSDKKGLVPQALEKNLQVGMISSEISKNTDLDNFV